MKNYTERPDTINPKMYEGLMDMSWQLGQKGISGFNKAFKGIAEGDTTAIRKETGTYFKVNGKSRLDKRRHNLRMDEYFHYNSGGKLIPRKPKDK